MLSFSSLYHRKELQQLTFGYKSPILEEIHHLIGYSDIMYHVPNSRIYLPISQIYKLEKAEANKTYISEKILKNKKFKTEIQRKSKSKTIGLPLYKT